MTRAVPIEKWEYNPAQSTFKKMEGDELETSIYKSFQEFCGESKHYKKGTEGPKLAHKGRFNT